MSLAGLRKRGPSGWEGGLWFLFLALWVQTLSREPESSQWPERAEQAAGGRLWALL